MAAVGHLVHDTGHAKLPECRVAPALVGRMFGGLFGFASEYHDGWQFAVYVRSVRTIVAPGWNFVTFETGCMRCANPGDRQNGPVAYDVESETPGAHNAHTRIPCDSRMHLIEEAFGEGCDLYEDVLSCRRDVDRAQLRKAYYRAALRFHPDRNAGDPEAHTKFQALSLAYEILQDEGTRREYDESGVIPEGPDEDVDNGVNEWKEYFDRIFGRVSTDQIDLFAQKYKCSEEEQRDVLQQFRKCKGNLMKMMDFVMLSEPRDAIRWVQDYIQPAIDKQELPINDQIQKNMDTSLTKAQKLAERGLAEEPEDDEDNDDETDSESEPASQARTAAAPTKASPRKAKHSQAKTKKAKHNKKDNNMNDLIAQIQNKRSGGSLLASLGARYGVDATAPDPLGDADWEAARKRVAKRSK